MQNLNSSFWWRGTLVWHLWIGRARHPGPGAASFAVEVFYVGGWLTHGDLVLETEVDFLTVVEHRLIHATVRGEDFVGKGWLLSGRLLLKILLMLVMLGLGFSVSGVLLFPCLPLLLRNSSVFLIMEGYAGLCPALLVPIIAGFGTLGGKSVVMASLPGLVSRHREVF